MERASPTKVFYTTCSFHDPSSALRFAFTRSEAEAQIVGEGVSGARKDIIIIRASPASPLKQPQKNQSL